jgi:uncharacterized protein involved in high-affinity Fe2+ transport
MASRGKTPAALAAALVCAAVAASVLNAGPSGDSAASRPAGERISIKPAYVAGDYVQHINMEMHQTTLVGEREVAAKSLMAMDAAVNVSRPDAKGNRTLTWQYTRIKQSTQAGSRTMSYDSASKSPQNEDLAKAFAPMLEVKFRITVGPDKKVKAITGLDAMWEKMAQAGPQAAAMSAAMKKQMGDTWIKGMVERSNQHLPAKPVAVGETWQSKEAMDMPMLGKTEVVNECKLKAIRKGAAGKEAVIGVATRMQTDKPGKIEAGPVTMTLKDMTMTMSGDTVANLANSMLSRTDMSQTGEMTMEMAGGDGEKATITTKFKIRMRMESARAPKAAPAKPEE